MIDNTLHCPTNNLNIHRKTEPVTGFQMMMHRYMSDFWARFMKAIAGAKAPAYSLYLIYFVQPVMVSDFLIFFYLQFILSIYFVFSM